MFETSIDSDGIAVIAWNIPDRPVNVMNEVTMDGFRAEVERVIADDAVKGVVIASAKDDFIAGADIDGFLEDLSVEALLPQFLMFDRIGRTMETCGKPFVAAINGHALGGGYETALCCHYRIAADNPKARIGLPEIGLGVLPGGGGTQRIPRMLGLQTGLKMLLDGRKHTVAEAAKLGLVDAVVPPEELLDAAKRWALDNPDATQPWGPQRLPAARRQRAEPGRPAAFPGGATPWGGSAASATTPRSRRSCPASTRAASATSMSASGSRVNISSR